MKKFLWENSMALFAVVWVIMLVVDLVNGYFFLASLAAVMTAYCVVRHIQWTKSRETNV